MALEAEAFCFTRYFAAFGKWKERVSSISSLLRKVAVSALRNKHIRISALARVP